MHRLFSKARAKVGNLSNPIVNLMTKDEATNAIRAALAKATGRTDLEYGDDTHLVEGEILDSLDASVFLLELEKTSGTKIADKDVETHDLFRVSNLTNWLCK